MSPKLETPPSASASPRRRRPLALPWLSPQPEKRAIQIGVLGTILIHLLLLWLAPHFLSMPPPKAALRKHAVPHTLNIEIAPDAFAAPKPKPPPPTKFVETNPNAPENVPDKTTNFSNRNQQVAQEKPTPNGKNDMPALAGRKDVQSNQIVTGQLSKPQESTPVAPAVTSPPKAAAAPRAEQNPIAGFEKMQGENSDAFGANIAKVANASKPSEDKVDGAKDAPLLQSSVTNSPPIDPTRPRPRPSLEQHVRPAIFTENKIGTQNIGLTAADARWSNYGVYLQRMIETIQIEWDKLVAASKVYPNSGSMVTVTFVLNSKGEIAHISRVEPSPGTADTATHTCVSGITTRSPYGPWTKDMIDMLGTEQELTFNFYYR